MAIHTRGVDIEIEPAVNEKVSNRPFTTGYRGNNHPKFQTRNAFIWGILGAAAIALAVWGLPKLMRKPPSEVVIASGRIEGRDVTLAPKEIQGRVKTLFVDEGYTVQKGQLLA